MAKVLVSYFSFTGKTKQLAEAAAEGASNAGAVVEIKESINTTVQDLVDADVWLVATPQTFGTMAAETKRMFERLYVARNELTTKPAFAVVVCHANAPVATLNLMDRFSSVFGFAKAADTLTVDASQLDAGVASSSQLGAALAKAG